MALYFLDWVRTQNQRQNRTRDAHKTSPQGTTTKRQPWTGTPRSAGVGGYGLALAILVGLGWVGQPELKQSPHGSLLLRLGTHARGMKETGPTAMGFH